MTLLPVLSGSQKRPKACKKTGQNIIQLLRDMKNNLMNIALIILHLPRTLHFSILKILISDIFQVFVDQVVIIQL